MNRSFVAAALAALLVAPFESASAQRIGPVAHDGIAPAVVPLPTQLTLEQALAAAEARSPDLAAARADVAAAQGRVRQAGFRANPEFSVELENFAGSGVLSGFQRTEITASINQRLDLAGHRRARVSASEARLFAAELQLAIARADLLQQVRTRFAEGIATRDLLALARADLLVCSISSFSAWAAFLSDAPYLWFAPQLTPQPDGLASIWGHEPLQQQADSPTRRALARWRREPALLPRGWPVELDGAVPAGALAMMQSRGGDRRGPADADLVRYGVAPLPASVPAPTHPLPERSLT